MKKILFYTDTPLLGGAENHMFLLAKFLPKERFRVTLACSNFQGLNSWCQRFLEIGVKVHRLNVLHKHDPRHYVYLKTLLPQFDLLHMHAWNPASGRYGFLAASKTPLVITEHDPFVLAGFKGWIKNKLLNRASRIIVASKAAAESMCRQDFTQQGKVRVIPNGIDEGAWRNESQLENRMEFRRTHFNSMHNETIILCVAELHERKGQKYLIQAVRKLAPEIPSLKLVLAGDGPARKRYEKLAQPLGEKIIFLGKRRDVAKLMAAADIFVLPSEREAFGLVLLEAGISGLPVIASRIGGIAEVIDDEKTGILVPPADAAKLEEKIRLLATRPEIGQELSRHNERRVASEFSAATMAVRTAAVYDEVLKK